MKAEPLKDKSEEMYMADEDKDVIYFRKEDVVAAVEWLKKQIEGIIWNRNTYSGKYRDRVITESRIFEKEVK